MTSSYETYMEGICLCKVKLNDGTIRKVKTLINCPCVYTPDWQEDGGFMHDEGWADWDIEDARVVYPDEFTIVEDDKELEPEEGLEITFLIEVLTEGDLVINL